MQALPYSRNSIFLLIKYRYYYGITIDICRFEPEVSLPLDDSVNATVTENITYVSPDGKYLFFHRTNDIYWVDAEVIHRLRPDR